MITWYSPKEKLPEVGGEIIVLLLFSGIKEVIICHAINDAHFKIPYMFDGHINWKKESYNNVDYWAYAKDFNFPKSEG